MLKLKLIIYGGLLCLIFPKPVHAYLDPGTGSYIFQILIAGILAGLLFIKTIIRKIKEFMNIKNIGLVIFIVVGIIVTYSVFNKMKELNYFQQKSLTTIPISPFPTPTVLDASSPSPTKNSSSGLEDTVKKTLKGAKESYGIVVRNLKTEESYYINEHRVYEPASLYKLWVMATAFKQIEAGKLKEDQTLSQDVQVLNDKFHIASESAELTEGTITLRVSDALNLMIDNSDNYAALLLSDRIKNSNIQKYLTDNGFDESSLGEPPKTSPYDIGLFFEKLYKGELANAENTQKMMDILKRQTLNNKIPKYLPKGVEIAHKTGEIDYFTHDAGIVFSDKGDYIIVVMSESDDPRDSEERIAEVSKAIYDYFEGIGF